MDGADQIYQGPDGTALRFFYQAVKNNFQSERAGRPVFDNALMMEVMVPGSRESTPTFEVERTFCLEAGGTLENRLVDRGPKYIQYQEAIERFKAQNGDGLVDGTPISSWATIDGGTAATLKAAGIYTVEMLAGVQDGHLQNLGTGGRVLRDQAQAFINTRQFGVPSAQMAAETANLREQVERLTADNQDLARRLTQAQAEVQALRTGNPPQNTGTLDPMSFQTTSQPDPLASLGGASPLTPTEGEASKNAGQQPPQSQAQPPQPQTMFPNTI